MISTRSRAPTSNSAVFLRLQALVATTARWSRISSPWERGLLRQVSILAGGTTELNISRTNVRLQLADLAPGLILLLRLRQMLEDCRNPIVDIYKTTKEYLSRGFDEEAQQGLRDDKLRRALCLVIDNLEFRKIYYYAGKAKRNIVKWFEGHKDHSATFYNGARFRPGWILAAKIVTKSWSRCTPPRRRQRTQHYYDQSTPGRPVLQGPRRACLLLRRHLYQIPRFS